ncbi:MAG: S-methyl-5-thioribose-1-phosphate isomerase [Verrucomicrobiae bacterium]|nr:S-methyl-5-thioribose-1-phosphate isomerase [Verrucomicrobiae bacterium]
MRVFGKDYRAVWMIERHGRAVVRVINQPLLPHKFAIKDLPTYRDTAEAIRDMTIRGAGTIGATAAFGLAQACVEAPDDGRGFWAYVRRAYDTLNKTRPTANDLKHSLDKIMARIRDLPPAQAKRAAVAEARAISDWYVHVGERIARNGLRLIKNGTRMLTHCNAGWLALQDWGSAPAPVYLAHRKGRRVFVWVDETRPRCQGAQLTSWEMMQEGVPHAIIPDNAAGFFMQRGEVDLVITGADRIAANGDTANKIGTYEKAVLARENGVPFYIAAPTSTIDLNCPSGDRIPIEERSADEVHFITGRDETGRLRRVRISPEHARARNPAFDVTPARYITGIITEHGIIPARASAIRRLFASRRPPLVTRRSA